MTEPATVRRFRLLDIDVTIGWPSTASHLGLDGLLDFVVPPAAGAPNATREAMAVRISIDPVGPGLVVRDGSRILAAGCDPIGAIDAAHAHLHRLAFATTTDAGWTRLHGALVDLVTGADRTRVLIVGRPGAGKSTLATRLLLEGAEVQGDEWVLVRDGSAQAFPRRLHLGSDAVEVLDDLGDRWPTLDRFPGAAGEVRALDPTDLGRPWRLTRRPVDVIAFLEPRTGGPNRIAPLSALAGAGLLLGQSFDPSRGRDGADPSGRPDPHERSRVVREVCRVVNTAVPATVQVNDLAAIVADLEAFVASVASARAVTSATSAPGARQPSGA